MVLQGYDWSVILAGFWNRAILTPAGIAKRLFGLEKGTPILVEVAMDGLGPPRVRHDQLTVISDIARLIIQADEPQYIHLDNARRIGVKAIQGLPETPLTAVGYNVRIKIEDPPDSLLTAIHARLDDNLSDANFTIDSCTLSRTMKWKEGMLNLEVKRTEDLRVEFNFHRQSSSPEELIKWLQVPIEEIREAITTIFDTVMKIPIGDIGA